MTETQAKPAKPRSARRRSRELAIQQLYGWLLNPEPASEVKRLARAEEGFANVDVPFFDRVIDGVISESDSLRTMLTSHLDRPIKELSPVEHAILLLGAYELSAAPETPYRVIINEAVDLTKLYGGTDGHKYVNGVLDKLVRELRPGEARARPN